MIKNRDAISELWKTFKSRSLNEQEQKLAEAYEQARAVFVKEGFMVANQALQAGDFEQAALVYASVVRPTYAKASAAADALRLYYANSGTAMYEGAQRAYETAATLLLGLSILVIALIAAFSYVFARSITLPLAGALKVADAVASGQLDNQIDSSGQDQVADLLRALEKMQSELKARLTAERRVADETLRIKVALDVSSNNVMVADLDGKIIYCNVAVLEMMRRAEADLRKVLPAFRADAILGSSFDIYHKNPPISRTCWPASRLFTGLKSRSAAVFFHWLPPRLPTSGTNDSARSSSGLIERLKSPSRTRWAASSRRPVPAIFRGVLQRMK